MDRLVLAIFTVRLVGGAYYNTFTGEVLPKDTALQMEAMRLVPWCAIEIADCNPHEPRRMDGSCNNLKYPSRGAQLTPYSRMLPPQYGADGGIRPAKSGNPLPNARALRVAIMSDGRAASSRFTNMVPNYNVFITGDITSVHDTANYVAVTTTCCLPGGRQDPRCLPIEVPPNDVHLRRTDIRCLNLTRAITYQRLGCVASSISPERINTAAPMLEMSIVYGHDGRGAAEGREYAGGRLRAELLKGREWPPTGAGFCVNNEPPRETRCHDSRTVL
ncbi:peroxidase-like [Manduca sexta]|uniref:peroxidase-like n=1 Tax=Manduca sexta TaxID=7130 RepID=UPI00188E9E82|nr:peroxidase-like [Manduca sexta]